MTTDRIADHIKFAYWVPNVSGGLVISDIERRTDWGYEYNVKLAQTAEKRGMWPTRRSRTWFSTTTGSARS